MPNRRNAFYILLIMSLLGGLFTGRAFFFSMAYLFGALLIFAWLWAWSSMWGIQMTRQTRTRRTQVGKTLDELFVVRNGSLLPKLWLEIRDFSNLPGHNISSVVPAILPNRSYRWTVHTTCVVRGEFTLGPITLISGDPFGLFQVSRKIAATSSVLVYPAAFPILDFTIPSGILSGGDAQRQRTHVVTTNASGVREYAPGDSFNRIHWKSSARKDRLYVKEFDLDPMADIWILLDLAAKHTYERPYSVEGGIAQEVFIPPSTAEYGIAIAASLSSYFLVKERALGFATYNPNRSVMQPDRGNRQITRIFESLALARPLGEVGFEQLVATEGHHMGRGTTAILITADPSEAWIREANLLTRRGVKTVAVIMDAASFSPNASVPALVETQLKLEGSGVITYPVRQNDNITVALSQRK